jgi:hypothetical protein
MTEIISGRRRPRLTNYAAVLERGTRPIFELLDELTHSEWTPQQLAAAAEAVVAHVTQRPQLPRLIPHGVLTGVWCSPDPETPPQENERWSSRIDEIIARTWPGFMDHVDARETYDTLDVSALSRSPTFRLWTRTSRLRTWRSHVRVLVVPGRGRPRPTTLRSASPHCALRPWRSLRLAGYRRSKLACPHGVRLRARLGTGRRSTGLGGHEVPIHIQEHLCGGPPAPFGNTRASSGCISGRIVQRISPSLSLSSASRLRRVFCRISFTTFSADAPFAIRFLPPLSPEVSLNSTPPMVPKYLKAHIETTSTRTASLRV